AVAPNTATDDVPFEGTRRAVMRTARAVVRLARQKGIVVPGADSLQDCQTRRNARCLSEALESWPELFGNQVGGQLAVHGEERRAVFGVLPEHARTLRHIVETVAQLRLDKGALLLDHDNLVQPSGKAPYDVRIKRIDHPQA